MARMKSLRVLPVTVREKMNHKRKGPKSTRSGCLMCKYHKHQAERHRDRAMAKRRWRQDERLASEGGRYYSRVQL